MSVAEDTLSFKWLMAQAKEIPQMYIIICVSICSALAHCKKYCHAALYQLQDLATLFSVNIPQEANVTNHTNKAVEQLATK